MNKGMLTVGIILLAVISLLLINVLNNFETGGELDYYLVKETTEAALQDAIDVEYLRQNGLVRIDKERFAENFLRRFADAVDYTRTYKVKMYDINEVPPKVSVKVDSQTVLQFDGTAADITTSYDAIMESNFRYNEVVESGLQSANSNLGKGVCRNNNCDQN